MEAILILLFMVIIGAVIGGLTNSLAIKMLFRPYEAKYIGKFKIPFTPGLIPKRQSELARQMGRTVVVHLLTPEAMKRKIQNKQFCNQVVHWILQELQSFAHSDATVKQLLHKVQIPVSSAALHKTSSDFIEKQMNKWIQENKFQPLSSIIPDEINRSGRELTPKASRYILQTVDEYIMSEEGKQKIGSLAEGYLGGTGFFGNMISSFLGGDGLAGKIQPAISQYVRSEDAHEMLTGLLNREWDKLQNKELYQFESLLLSESIQRQLANELANMVPFEQLLNTKISTLYNQFQPVIENQVIPTVVTKVQAYLVDQMGSLMERLNLQELVKEEVEKFDVERLESMVLGISKRELKMITYLGALLGGFIGLIQAMIVLLSI
ncbi:DUF445 domain-containing protein [Salinibacillus xinjiangensis]|uniref:DUF445 family protein n=1 Tax=Salinibacillus xinjiangensis TaxID=1229268 RepID=A0A6G1X7M2_9BACI|nr:DUF445 family protein [Salinibacillus xinjiangensis]MRG86906.1 DUF445 family protein [Salinibacillus xinjiangensis]